MFLFNALGISISLYVIAILCSTTTASKYCKVLEEREMVQNDLMEMWFTGWRNFRIVTAVTRLRCFIKKLFWKISQNSQENSFTGLSFLIKLQTCCKFSCEFCKIFQNSRTAFLQRNSGDCFCCEEFLSHTVFRLKI